MSDGRGCRSYKENVIPLSARQCGGCGTASDTVDTLRSASPKGFKFLVVVINSTGFQTLYFTTTYAAFSF